MSVENQKSIKVNMLLNAIRGIMSAVFPLITFPYVSRILGAESLGQYSFARSIIGYFTLLAGLGIANYAIRDGAAIREDPQQLNRFANEIFTINILSTAFSYAVLALVLFAAPTLGKYMSLLVIFSFQVVLNTIGIEWIYSIYEDYLYVTLRSIFFQFVSLVLLFCFVHTKDDVEIYAVITVLACAGSNLLNFYHARRWIKIRLTNQIDWKRHLQPIFTMFAMSLTVSVYVSSDITVLGLLCGDRTVGIYTAATKIYGMVKNVLSTVLVVSIPRLSALFGTGRLEMFRRTGLDIYKTVVTVTVPAVTGILLLSKPIVLLVSGEEFIETVPSLQILSIALLLCMAAYYWEQCVLIPMRCEDEVFKATAVSAVLNLVLNVLLIPVWQEKAAAFTTVVAEGCSCVWSTIQGRKRSGVTGVGSTYLKAAVGCMGIVAVNAVTKHLFVSNTLYVVMTVALSVIVYGAVEIVLKNDAVYSWVRAIRARIGLPQISHKNER